MRVLAIDPGNIESGWALVDLESREPVAFGKDRNEDLRRLILTGHESVSADHVAVEMVASYGMAVGLEVFETCVWIGRFCEAVRASWWPWKEPQRVFRRDVKLHHCMSAKAKDSNVRQALVDRFAPGAPNYGKGTKSEPGWFHGFKADIWQAYALGVYVADTHGRTDT